MDSYMDERSEKKVQFSVQVTAQEPGDLLGYIDWDNPKCGYWAETTPRELSYARYHGKYKFLYQKHQFDHGDIYKLFEAFLSEDDEEFRKYVVICVYRLKLTQEMLADLISRSYSIEILTRALAVRAIGIFAIAKAI